MPISVYVPALTFNQVTGIDIHIITLVVCVICTIYTSLGGIKAVVWTDVLQAFIMVGSLALVIVKGTFDVGGLNTVYQRNLESERLVMPDWTLDPTVRMSFLSVFVGGTMFKIQGSISQPAVQRFLTLPNKAAVKKALIIFNLGIVFLLGLCIYLGLLAYSAYYDCDPITTKLAKAKDQVVPLYVMQTAGTYPGIAGCFVSGVFSAALSSLSTALNSLSAVVLKDFIEPYRKTPLTKRQTAFILRGVVVVFGIASMCMVDVVQKLGMVMQLSSTFNSMIAGPVMGLFIVGMFMPFVGARSALAGSLIAACTVGIIVVRAQIDIASGNLTFPTKPVSVDGCTYEFEALNMTLQEDLPEEISRPLHHMSFLLYTLVGTTLTLICSALATLIFGCQDVAKVDPALLTPVIRRFLKLNQQIKGSWITFNDVGEIVSKQVLEKSLDGVKDGKVLLNEEEGTKEERFPLKIVEKT